jgi:3-oxoacyl-[acyl-carrier protein] reductase
MDLGIKGKTALVTAASQGMGAAVAAGLAAEGARVALCARREDRLQATAEQIRQSTGGEVWAQRADITRAEDLQALFAAVKAQFGGLDLLFVNGGAPPAGTFTQLSPAQWEDAFHTVLLPVVNVVRGALELMSSGGSIVVNSSNFVRQPSLSYTTATSLRLAVLGLVKTLADELGPRGIRVNAIAPGSTRTEVMEEYIQAEAQRRGVPADEVEHELAASIPLGRFATPEEIGNVAVFLLSPRASFAHGGVWLVDGGESRNPV